jgi:TonB-dependent starch-binding outer membrane protein SusC
VGGALPTLAASETSSSPKVENVQQNEVTIKGVVKDANGEAIIGASVIEKGNAKNGTVTDIDGNYTLKVKRGATLTISYIGYVSKETKGGNIILEEDLKSLNEVVVIGYGTQKKADVTSAVVSVKAEDFTKGNFNDAGDLIKGKVAGLTITKPSGDPGAVTQISLRGIATVSGNAQPLVLFILNDVFVVFNVLLFCCFYIFFIVSSPSSVFPQRHESCRGFHFRRSRISEPFCHN